MKALRTLGLAAVVVLGGIGAAAAGPMSIAPGEALSPAQPAVDTVAWVCGPYRCWHRPSYYGGYRWRYHHWGYRRWY